MDLDGFKNNEDKKEWDDEQEITKKVYNINSPKCKDQDYNDKDKLEKLSCDLCSYKYKKKYHFKKTHDSNPC